MQWPVERESKLTPSDVSFVIKWTTAKADNIAIAPVQSLPKISSELRAMYEVNSEGYNEFLWNSVMLRTGSLSLILRKEISGRKSLFLLLKKGKCIKKIPSS